MTASAVSSPLRRELGGMSARQVLGALAELPGAFWMSTDSGTFAGALPSSSSTAFDPAPSLPLPAGGADGPAVSFPCFVGVLPYEAVRTSERTPGPDPRPPAWLATPRWQAYGAVVEFGSEGPLLVGSTTSAVDRLEAALHAHSAPLQAERAALRWAWPPEAEEVHERRIERALELISRGELYQVNLARRFGFHCQGHPFALLSRLAVRGLREVALDPLESGVLAPYAAAFAWGDMGVVSTSPESFLDLGPGGFIATRPIKGTRPRHPDPTRDRALAAELDRSEKERAELAMVVDIERNDLGRLALPGSVRLAEPPRVVSLATVHHRHALVTAQLRPEVSRADVLRTMMPSGSVTGAPKVRAMDLIRELEAERRGLYTGALGAIFSDGRVELSMAIRCLVVRSGQAEYFSGGGIVADSDPKAEVLETLWKAEQLLALLGERGLESGI